MIITNPLHKPDHRIPTFLREGAPPSSIPSASQRAQPPLAPRQPAPQPTRPRSWFSLLCCCFAGPPPQEAAAPPAPAPALAAPPAPAPTFAAAAAELPKSVFLHHAVLEARARSRKAEAAAAQSRARAMEAGASAAGALARTVETHVGARRGLAAARAAVLLRAAVLHKPQHVEHHSYWHEGEERARALAAPPPSPPAPAPPSPRDAHVAALRAELEVARAAVEAAEGRVADAFSRR